VVTLMLVMFAITIPAAIAAGRRRRP